jgi:hypothetical protein
MSGLGGGGRRGWGLVSKDLGTGGIERLDSYSVHMLPLSSSLISRGCPMAFELIAQI